MRLVVPVSAHSLRRAIAHAGAAAPTFDTTSADAGDRSHYAHDRRDGVVGHGVPAFAAARDGLAAWAAHRVAGARVFPPGAPVTVGTTVLVTFGTPLLAFAAPCRVTEVVDELGRFGYTYVTLQGHPEEGEESFVVQLDGLGDVRFTIEARSRPSSALVRAAAPVGRLVQRRVARGYLRALERHVARAGSRRDGR